MSPPSSAGDQSEDSRGSNSFDGMSKSVLAPGIVGVAAPTAPLPGSATASEFGGSDGGASNGSVQVQMTAQGQVQGSPESKAVSSSAREQKRFPPWLIISTWISLSTAVIFYNVLILRDWNFPYPITLTTLHLAFQSLATQLLARYTDLVPPPVSSSASSSAASNSPAGGKDYIPLPNLTPKLDGGGSMAHRRTGSEGFFINSNSTNGDVKRHDEEPIQTGTGPQTHQSGWAWRFRVRPKPTIDRSLYWRRIVPIGFLFSASLVLSNAVYLYLSVAFIQMIKSASPVAVLITNFAWGLRPISFKLLSIVALISIGICIASYGELAFSTLGFVLQCVAIIVEANRVVLIQMLLQGEGMTPITTLYFFAPVCLAINALFILPLEGWQAIYAIPQLGFSVILTNAAATLLLNLSAVYLIQLSSLVLSLSKVVKDLVLIFGSGLVLGTPIEPLQWLGYSIALAGLVGYKLNS